MRFIKIIPLIIFLLLVVPNGLLAQQGSVIQNAFYLDTACNIYNTAESLSAVYKSQIYIELKPLISISHSIENLLRPQKKALMSA
jgi:hypothetical protein